MSNTATVNLDTTELQPGDRLRGSAQWDVEKAPRKISLRLFWHTKGKGTEDVELVEEIEIDSVPSNPHYAFDFALPVCPYSFSGSLISLEWGVELIVGRTIDKAAFTMAPNRVPLSLSR